MKAAIVCGAGGFIGGHLMTYLIEQDYYVIGIDLKFPPYENAKCDEFWIYDLRQDLTHLKEDIEGLSDEFELAEFYQLAADMGGMGFIHSHELDCLTNNVQINLNCLKLASELKFKRYFYSSSVCIYPDMQVGDKALTEEQAYPANPDNEYGWEKLYSERVALTYGKNTKMQVRIARFQNCYGPYGTFDGGREKAPAAICRKVATSENGKLEIWGDGTAVRNFIYVDDLVDAVYKLMQSNIPTPTNIGTEEYVSVNELADTVIEVSGKRLKKVYVNGPVGVQSRNFDHSKIRSLGWSPKVTLEDGLEHTYKWIKEQVELDGEAREGN